VEHPVLAEADTPIFRVAGIGAVLWEETLTSQEIDAAGTQLGKELTS
jgi:hypothetical protein